MIIRVNDTSNVPIYLQIRNQIVEGISKGSLLPGETLPSVRALADEIGINSMTVNKSYQMLKQEGYIVTDRRKGAKVSEMGEYLQRTLDTATLEVATGTFDYNTTLKKVVSEMTKSGVRSIDYETGFSNRIEVAARRALMTGVNQVVGHINERNADALDTDYFEVSWHATARPTHQEWQGRIYTRKELTDICGLGTVTGLHGANCYHSYYPYIEGISKRQWTDRKSVV